jgi:hypothetical protein
MTPREVAQEIHALINSRPRSPTVEEIEAVVLKVRVVPFSALVNMRVDLTGANGDEAIARISQQAARAAAETAALHARASKPVVP